MRQLEYVRAEIESIDQTLVRLIGARVRAARRAAAAKRVAGLPAVDPAQEAVVVQRAAALARDLGLPPDEIGGLFSQLIGLTRRAELQP
ncbi:MAG TPA: chorismate mutase [Gemmatimonadales bacterium]|jgi:chorismate mutase|nr:chorismate mutase [Gemmatimonadales bacterium]